MPYCTSVFLYRFFKLYGMKLNLEIELDWIDEEMNLDDVVKDQIISGVMKKINEKVLSKIEDKINNTIDKTIIARINKCTDKMFKDFLKRPVNITDRYGDSIEHYKNVNEVIKMRFDNFMTQTVDEKGNTYDGSYSKKFQRLEFVIDKQLKDFANKFTTDAVKRVSEEIKLHVKDGLTNKLGAELMQVLKVDKMLQMPTN